MATSSPDPLIVSRLTLTNFRCYDYARLQSTRKHVVLVGDNGAGKTNVLEALSLLAPGRGMRHARIQELSRRDPGCDEDSARLWGVAATIHQGIDRVEIGTGRDDTQLSGTRERRLVRIEGEKARSQSVLSDYMDVVWLTPQMDRLFVEGSAGRRRFLDRLVYGFDPHHATRINGYEHALRERARLLKAGQTDDVWLSALESRMASEAVAVAAARRDIGARLNILSKSGYGPFPGGEITPTGLIEQALDHQSALEVEDDFKALLKTHRGRDAKIGGAIDGVHKSDLKVRHVPKDQPAETCSTGEQKALLSGLILANVQALALDRGRIPLVLLDEVGAHLDEARRAALFEAITELGAQTWMTGTDLSWFDPIRKDADIFSVQQAKISVLND